MSDTTAKIYNTSKESNIKLRMENTVEKKINNEDGKKPFFVSWRLLRVSNKKTCLPYIDLNAWSHAIYIRHIISIRPYARKINNIDEKRGKKVEMIHISIIMLTGSHTTFTFALLFSTKAFVYRSFKFFLFFRLGILYRAAARRKVVSLLCKRKSSNAAKCRCRIREKNVIVSFIFSLSGWIAWYSFSIRRCRYKCFYLKCLVSLAPFSLDFYSDYSIFIWKSVALFLLPLFTLPFCPVLSPI